MPFKIIQLFRPTDRSISRQILSLGLPVIAGNLSRTIMNITDIAMVGHLGTAALAAVGMGSMLVWVALSIAIGLRTATQTVSSRRLGQKKFIQCGTAVHNGLLLAVIIIVPFTIFGFTLAAWFVPFFINDAQTIALCVSYTSVAFLSVFFSSLGFVFQGFFTGVEKTNIHMKVTISSNLLNIYLNAGLIYGTVGIKQFFASIHLTWLGGLWSWVEFPALGVKGAALATLIASVWLMVHYFLYLFNDNIREKFGVFRWTFDKKMLKKQFMLAAPQGFQQMIVTMGYAVFFKIVGLISVVALAATEVVFTILQASFMPGAGIGQACATLVGKSLGEENPHRAEICIIESVRLSFWIMGSVGVVFLAIPGLILPVFTNDPAVIHTGVFGLRMAGLVQFADAAGLTLWFALSGAGNTRFPAIIESITMWGVCLPLSYLTGVYWGWGFVGPWLAFGLNIVLFASLMVWKVGRGDWKTIQV